MQKSQRNKLNDEAYDLLRERRMDPRFQHEFSLIFVGDSHFGQDCSSGIPPEAMYRLLLERIRKHEKKYGKTLAIIHGGDGTHGGRKHLEKFIAVTRHALNYDASVEARIPIFMNVGNQEYINDPHLKNYNTLVGNGNHVEEIWLRPQNTCVLMLNTGGPESDGCSEDNERFFEQVQAMEAIIKSHPHYRFLIDMHIPPAIGPHKGKIHALNNEYTALFVQFLNNNLNRITAVVTHHRHGLRPTSSPYWYQGKIPIYLTAYGGNCDGPGPNALNMTHFRNAKGIWRVKTSII